MLIFSLINERNSLINSEEGGPDQPRRARSGTRLAAPSLGRVGDVVALFPLGTVLFPGQPLPLHVFEPRYRDLVRTLLERPESQRLFGVVAIRSGHEVGADAVRDLHPVGCTARVHRVHGHADGRFDLLTVGDRRFALDRITHDLAYLQGEVRWLPEVEGDADTVVAAVRREVEAYRAETGVLADELPHDPRELSYRVAVTLPLDLAQRQALLAAPDDGVRLRALLRLLRHERAVRRVLPSRPGPELGRAAVSPN